MIYIIAIIAVALAAALLVHESRSKKNRNSARPTRFGGGSGYEPTRHIGLDREEID